MILSLYHLSCSILKLQGISMCSFGTRLDSNLKLLTIAISSFQEKLSHDPDTDLDYKRIAFGPKGSHFNFYRCTNQDSWKGWTTNGSSNLPTLVIVAVTKLMTFKRLWVWKRCKLPKSDCCIAIDSDYYERDDTEQEKRNENSLFFLLTFSHSSLFPTHLLPTQLSLARSHH